MSTKVLSLITIASFAAFSDAAITFSNFTYGPGAVAAGFATGPAISGNSLTWQPANASVGFTPTPTFTTIALTYDAKSTGGNIGWVLGSVASTTQGFVLGTGIIGFQEDVFALDANGNETGLPIGHVAESTVSTGNLAPTTITLSQQVQSVRIKKSFFLTTGADSAVSYAAIAQVNQSVQAVPEPASLAALAIGALGLLRRRKRA